MRRRILIATVAVVLVAIAAFSVRAYSRRNLLEASGTIEARNIRVGSKVGGRVAKVHVQEGDIVKAGDVLVSFEDAELAAALEQARGRLQRAQAAFEKSQRGLRPEEVDAARAAEAAAEAQYRETRTGYRQEQVEQARAEAERARAEAVNAQQYYRRVSGLAEEGVMSRQQRDDAEARWKAAVAASKAADERRSELERGFRPEDIAAARARFQQQKAARVMAERGNRVEDVRAAKAELLTAEGAFQDAQAKFRERQVIAPAAATVEVLDVRPGDLVAPNTPVAILLERDEIFVRIYVPETRVARLKPGQSAQVFTDAYPDKPLNAVVEQISQKAEFLPRNVQTASEREHQVFAVKLRIKDVERARPGVAADVRLQLRED